MTQDERARYNKAINVISYKIIDRTYFESMPTNEQLDAILLGIKAMNLLAYDSGMNLKRQIAILTYHINQPNALIFRDRYTLDACSKAVYAIRYMLGKVKL